MPHTLLNDRSVIALTGGDCIAFLQGLITNDANLLSQGKPLYAALLTPQGKFLYDFFLIPAGGRILLDVHLSRADELMARLGVYRLRAQVQFERLSLPVMASWDKAVQTGSGVTIEDPRLAALGWRMYGSDVHPTALPQDYDRHRIRLGVPDGAYDMQPDKSLLLEFHFEALHGVSFSKGCYVGQEVTARSKFRGQVRKILAKVYSTPPLPGKGTEVLDRGNVVGELLSAMGNDGLALVRSEALEQEGSLLTAGGNALSVSIPGWARPIISECYWWGADFFQQFAHGFALGVTLRGMFGRDRIRKRSTIRAPHYRSVHGSLLINSPDDAL